MLFLERPRATTHSAFFFFNDTATTEIYTLSLHDALPISLNGLLQMDATNALPILKKVLAKRDGCSAGLRRKASRARSEEHTSELQSRLHLVCRLLLEKKKNNRHTTCTVSTCRATS